MSLRKIIGDGSIYVVGDIVSKAAPFFLMPYLTRKLGTDGFGEFSLYQTVVAFLAILLCLCQEGAISRYYFKYGTRNISAVIFSGFIVSTSMSFFFVIFGAFLFNYIFVFLVLCGYSQVAINVLLTLRQLEKDAVSYVKVQVASTLLSVALTLVIFEFTYPEPVYRIVTIFLANFLILSYAMIVNFDRLLLSELTRKLYLNLKFVIAIGLPLSFHQLGILMKGQLDRFVVYDQMSKSVLGQYSAAYQLSSVFLILFMALNKAMVPYFYDLTLHNENHNGLMKWFHYSVVVAIFPVFTMSLTSNDFFLFVVGSEFGDVKKYSVLFSLGIGLHAPYLVLVNYLLCMNKSLCVVVSTFISTVLYCFCLFAISNTYPTFMPLALFFSNMLNVILLLYFSLKKSHISQVNLNG